MRINATILQILKEVSEFFDGDLDKTALWMNTENLNIGGVTPVYMIYRHREDKLLDWILHQKYDTSPADQEG